MRLREFLIILYLSFTVLGVMLSRFQVILYMSLVILDHSEPIYSKGYCTARGQSNLIPLPKIFLQEKAFCS
jgi:hypothetical protein